jgi:hypothetical protein
MRIIPDAMNIRLGPPVTADNFYPRPALISRILRALERGNVAFLGPRRTGKTSCLKAILSNPPTGYVPILLNLEKHDTVIGWLTDMVTAVRTELDKPGPKAPWVLQHGGAFLKRIEQIQVMGTGIKLVAAADDPQPWRKPADEFLNLLKESDAPFLFLLDEFPAFLNLVALKNSREEVEAVLSWFRSARHELIDRAPRFLVTGSIGLKGVVRRLDLSPSINDFDTLEIPPLADGEALNLLERLANDNHVPLDNRGRRHILDLLGANWPILLQLFICEIQDESFKKAPTKAQLDHLYRERVVSGNRNEYCYGMFTRLKQAFSESECRLAREILKTICRSDHDLTREEFEAIHVRLVPDATHRALLGDELDYVLDTLKHDGYLLQETGGEQRTRFASNILRDYWLRKTS